MPIPAQALSCAGLPINVIGKTVERIARKGGFSVIENLAGHGVGGALHEAPANILSFYDATDRRMLREGMVIAVEPFLSTGATYAEQGDDGWTLVTPPRFLTAQYEHSIVVTRGAPIVLTALA